MIRFIRHFIEHIEHSVFNIRCLIFVIHVNRVRYD